MKLIVFLYAFFSASIYAQALPVEIKNLKGEVLYYRNRTISILTERTELKNEDLLMTKNGYVSLVFEETTLTFTPHSLFKVVNLKNNERHQFGEFLMGEFYSETRDKLVDKRRLEVLLPKAKVYVLGTKYFVQIASSIEKLLARESGEFSELPRLELIPEAVSSNDLVTQVSCLEGKVQLETDSGQKKELVINESGLYSGSGANLRMTMKDQDSLNAQLSSLGISQIVSKATEPSPSELKP